MFIVHYLQRCFLPLFFLFRHHSSKAYSLGDLFTCGANIASKQEQFYYLSIVVLLPILLPLLGFLLFLQQTSQIGCSAQGVEDLRDNEVKCIRKTQRGQASVQLAPSLLPIIYCSYFRKSPASSKCQETGQTQE